MFDVRGQFVSVVPWLGCRGVGRAGSVREGCEEIAGGGEEAGSWGAYPEQVGWGWEFFEVCLRDGGGEILGVSPGDAAVVA